LKNIKKSKVIILTIVSFVILGTITGGTYAWLSDRTPILSSNFTYGDIKISINDNDANYKILPSAKIKKETIITVLKQSEDCWLFAEINKSENFEDFMIYELEENWLPLEGYQNVYYQEVSKKNENQEFNMIKNNFITVKSDITKQMLSDLDKDKNYPTFTVTAYAVQRNSEIEDLSTASKAWLLINNQQ